MNVKHRYNRKAEDFYVEKVEDPWKPGEISLTFSIGTEGTKNRTVDHIQVRVPLYQLNRLVEEARKIVDAQISRLQGSRNRLG